MDMEHEKTSDEALAELEKLRRYHERIQSLEKVRNEANLEVEARKLELKEAKEHAKLCEKNLQRAIRGDDQQRELPFKDIESSQGDESWREVTIEDAGIPEKLCVFLLENKPPIETIGDLSEWTSKYQLTDINGIGPAKQLPSRKPLMRFGNRDSPRTKRRTENEVSSRCILLVR